MLFNKIKLLLVTNKVKDKQYKITQIISDNKINFMRLFGWI